MSYYSENRPTMQVVLPRQALPAQPQVHQNRTIFDASYEYETIQHGYETQLYDPTSQPDTIAPFEAVGTRPLEHARNTAITSKPSAPEGSDQHALLLLALADEYIAAAYRLSAAIVTGTESSTDAYHKLLATAMTSLEAALSRCRFSDPSLEARVGLRLAGLLLRETNNDEQVQSILNKGIALCQRHRLLDLGYSMQYLLVQATLESNRRAAHKLIDKILVEADTHTHTHWSYAFRFLRISFAARTHDPQHLRYMRELTSFAQERSQFSVVMLGLVLEALLCTQMGSVEGVELAQRALASVRSLSEETRGALQILALANILDLACELVLASPERSVAKVQAMQGLMDNAIKGSDWHESGTFMVSLDVVTSGSLEQDTDGIFRKVDDGKCALPVDWITQSELYSIGYLMSGVAALQRNCRDTKAEKYLREGLKLNNLVTIQTGRLLRDAELFQRDRHAGWVALNICLAYSHCNQSRWKDAWRIMESLAEQTCYSQACLYLEGMILQGQGNPNLALERYMSPELSLMAKGKMSGFDQDMRTLAALNATLILGSNKMTRPQVSALLDGALSRCEGHHNRSIVSAMNILRAAVAAGNIPVVLLKKHIQGALQPAKSVQNRQLLYIVLNLVDVRLFKGILGEQAERSAHTSARLCEQAQNPLWNAVAVDKWSRCLQLQGKGEEARAKAQLAERYFERIEPMLKERFVITT